MLSDFAQSRKCRKMKSTKETRGGLTCQIVDMLPRGANPKQIVVLAHGFGAPGTDLVPLAEELFIVNSQLATTTRFVFPAAPLLLDRHGEDGGRAWWWIDLEARIAAIERGEIDLLRKEKPEGMAEASKMLLACVEECLQVEQLSANQLVIGGFSQGARVATDVALRMAKAPAGLVIMSGTLLCEDEWTTLAQQRGPMSVLQSHGTYDPILPYQAAEWLADLWQQCGMSLEFLPFDGPHTIPPQMLFQLADQLPEWLPLE